ncbi:CRISPR-associated Cas5e family protein [Deinococcus phoenicis]|uniref:CRISPR-associated Cas5e family protein n=1 Tax=Deinococcus phoenicis TaxID=1476583 RepID=A0A016QV80_9DEIO|nr:type I-E CRISPR-associated protein Cas5/CasD [Deinococcus phoenicis]EYB69787.1 CRISPR-associated Cas5e family protein [Deinococcus phoenicis]
MATLLLRLAAPMQAWGTRSRFDDRDSEAEPSRSGVLGLAAAALGIDRAEPVDHLARLAFGVRVDREGVVGTDYHTAQLSPGSPKTRTDVTRRAYLADAAFWAGLEGDPALLTDLHAALRNPHWPLSLGRKAFQPSLPVFERPPLDLPLWETLLIAPSLRRPPLREWEENTEDLPYRLVLDRERVPEQLRAGASPSRRQDVPDGPFAARRYRAREVLTLTRCLTPEPDPLLGHLELGTA